MAKTLRVAMVASEAFPFAKVGGLGDAVPALAKALDRQGAQVRLFLPRYRGAKTPAAGRDPSLLGEAVVDLGPEGKELARFERTRLPDSGVEVLLVGSERFFDREGVYDDPETGEGYADNVLRFTFFQRAVAQALRQGVDSLLTGGGKAGPYQPEKPFFIHVDGRAGIYIYLQYRRIYLRGRVEGGGGHVGNDIRPAVKLHADAEEAPLPGRGHDGFGHLFLYHDNHRCRLDRGFEKVAQHRRGYVVR